MAEEQTRNRFWVIKRARELKRNTRYTLEDITTYYTNWWDGDPTNDEPDPEPPVLEPPEIISVSLVPSTGAVSVMVSIDEPGPLRIAYRVIGNDGWTLGPDETSYDYADHVQNITGLNPLTDYEMRITAYDEAGETEKIISFRTLAPVIVPVPDPGDPTRVGPRPSTAPPSDAIALLDSQDLQTVIDAAPNGSWFRMDKRYTRDRTIELRGRRGLTFWGGGTGYLKLTSTTGSSAQSGFKLRDGCEDITIRGLEIDGPNYPVDKDGYDRRHYLYRNLPGEHSAGVMNYEARNTTVEDCVIHNTNGDGLYTSGNYYAGGVGPFTFRYNRIFETGRQGIVPNQGSYLVTHNEITDVVAWPFDAEDGSDPRRVMEEVRFTDNVMTRWNWWTNAVIGPGYTSRAVSMSHDDDTFNRTINHYEVSRNVWNVGPMGMGNPDLEPRHSRMIAFYSNQGPSPKVKTFIVEDNVSNLDPNRLADTTAVQVHDAVNLRVRGNDFQGMEILHRRTTGIVDIGDNGSSPIRT